MRHELERPHAAASESLTIIRASSLSVGCRIRVTHSLRRVSHGGALPHPSHSLADSDRTTATEMRRFAADSSAPPKSESFSCVCVFSDVCLCLCMCV